ncbi:uncharacterized protein [Miscanthus floridulus]|uniref:uncharacterized protein isoform X3 n=1 Tax=Miscanthus floridulus TaxID=154761 RepID=UPI00345891D3
MVYQRADPSPFIPHNMQLQEIPNQEFMTRAIAPLTPPSENEDLAIAVFDPLPDSEAEDSSKGKELDDAEAAQSSTRKRSAKCSPALVETQTKMKKSRPIARARIVPVIQDNPEEKEGEQEQDERTDDQLQLLEKHQASDGEA